MVKKIKRFIVFCLFSFFFSLLSGKVEKPSGKKDENNNQSWNAAKAGQCCPQNTVALCNGTCCEKACKTDKDGNQYCP